MRRIPLILATVSAGAIVAGSGFAYAGTVAQSSASPAPGTAACETLLAADTTLQGVISTNTPIVQGTTATDAQRATAQAAINAATKSATNRLCTGTAATPTTTSSSSSTTSTVPPATTTTSRNPSSVICSDFSSQKAAQAYYDEHHEATRLDSNSNGVACEGAFGSSRSSSPSETTTPLPGTADDGSTARTSGSQVQVVPSGSADTGDGSTVVG